MKTLILAVLVLAMASISNAQNVNIPDANFKNALISAGVDKNTDGEISYAECEAIKELRVYEKNISDMTGIEAFTNLVLLNCNVNQITSLDVSHNTALTELYCDNNQLTNLNISGCIALGYLDCGFNQLTSVDVTNNPALGYLACISNQLTSLDVTNNTALGYLNCSLNKLRSLDVSDCNALIYLLCFSNRLTSLDVTNNTALGYLDCPGNQITSLDVSDCVVLGMLTCHKNQLTSLDVSGCTVLWELTCWENQLTSLDVSKNTALGILNISFMPDLHEVCVWKMPFPPTNVFIDTTGSPNVYFTTDCLTNIQGDYKENNTIDIYPNPSDGIINIDIENINNATIEIYDVNGTLIFSKALNSNFEKIDISGFSGGLYLVKVKQDSTVIIGKVVVR